MNVFQSQSHTTARLDYSTIHISEWEAMNVIQTFQHAVSSIVRNPSQLIGEVDLLSVRDKNQISLWNKYIPEEISSCVHHMIHHVALENPTLEAIHSWDGTMSYRELDDLSSSLAGYLIKLGVGPEIIVPLCFEKSKWAIVSMMAVLKAGGACVSLDPAHPQSRRQNLIKQVKGTILLTSKNSNSSMLDNVHTIIVDLQLFDNLPTLFTPPSVAVTPKNSAFVVFTSGSTGQPKAIIQEHGAFCASARDYTLAIQLDSKSRVLQFAAYTFDVSNSDIFTALMNGCCLCIPSEEDRVNNLAAAIREMNVNTACLTPTVATLLSPEEVPSIRILSLAGEAMKKDIIIQWQDKCSLVNIYG